MNFMIKIFTHNYSCALQKVTISSESVCVSVFVSVFVCVCVCVCVCDCLTTQTEINLGT